MLDFRFLLIQWGAKTHSVILFCFTSCIGRHSHELFCFIYMIQVSGIVDQLVRFGKVTRPILGIRFAPDQSVEQIGLSGVLVLDAPASGPAGKAVRPINPHILFF